MRQNQDSEGGAILILTALCLFLIVVPLAAYGVTLGTTVISNTTLQSMADAGAYDAVQALNTSNVNTTVANSLTHNDADITDATESGVQGCVTTVSGAPSFAASTCSGGAYNAVKVTASAPQPHFLIGGSTLSKSAIAEQTAEAGLSVGTDLLSFSSSKMADAIPVLNTLFGALGASSSLTAVGYNGLADGNVTLASLISASGGVLSPTNILSLGITPAGWTKLLDAADPSLPDAVSYGGSTASGCTPNDSTCLDLCQLMTITPFCPSGILPASDLGLSLNVLQTLTTAAELANGSSGLSVTSALNLGITSASLSVSVISPPTMAFGPVGTSATNGQVDATLTLATLLGNVIVAIDGATGTGTISSISCTAGTLNSVGITGSTNAASTAVTVLGVKTSATITGASSTLLTFNAAAIPPTATTATATGNNQNPQTIGSTDPTLTTGSLLSIVTLTTLTGFLTGTLLSPIFQSLGVSLANASISALSTNCSAVSLVQ
jgi:uncharacterized membrane protein